LPLNELSIPINANKIPSGFDYGSGLVNAQQKHSENDKDTHFCAEVLDHRRGLASSYEQKERNFPKFTEENCVVTEKLSPLRTKISPSKQTLPAIPAVPPVPSDNDPVSLARRLYLKQEKAKLAKQKHMEQRQKRIEQKKQQGLQQSQMEAERQDLVEAKQRAKQKAKMEKVTRQQEEKKKQAKRLRQQKERQAKKQQEAEEENIRQHTR
jgi:colicin import membrane protein